MKTKYKQYSNAEFDTEFAILDGQGHELEFAKGDAKYLFKNLMLNRRLPVGVLTYTYRRSRVFDL